MKIMSKESLHLGQIIQYEGKDAVVDALTQSSVGLVVDGGYVIVSWESLA